MENLVTESLKFMVLGMGIVYVLLAFIVFLTNLQAKIIAKYFPDKSDNGGSVRAVKGATTTAKSDGALIAAISAAISYYKKN